MMRSVEDMIALRNPPLAPGCNSIGRHLVDLDSHQCRFPVGGDAGGTRFCAVEISPGEWLPGKVNGCAQLAGRLVDSAAGTARAAQTGKTAVTKGFICLSTISSSPASSRGRRRAP